MNNPALTSRIRANEKYEASVKTAEQMRDNQLISPEKLAWWKHKNPYQYEDTYDENGNIIGGTVTEYNTPHKDVNWTDVVKKAADLTQPIQRSTTRGHEGGTTNADGTGTRKGYDKTNTTTIRSTEAILETLKEMQGDMYAAIEEQRESDYWNLQQLKAKADSMPDGIEKENMQTAIRMREKTILPSLEKYVEYHINHNPLAKQMRLSSVTTSYKDSNYIDNETSNKTGNSYGGGDDITGDDVNAAGWGVEKKGQVSILIGNVQANALAVSKQFSKLKGIGKK
jgi:hypothetical protein